MGLSVNVLKKVNGFTLEAQWQVDNELAVLFGYSGSGKSLTLHLIAGLMAPDRGKIISDGQTLYDHEERINVSPQKRSFGYVCQNLALFPHMTVKQNIKYGAKGLKRQEQEEGVRELLETFYLQDLENKLPGEISGGQKQRVALARTLIRQPQALLLDEPFSALDNPLRLEMRQFLQEIRKKFQVPVILVTHDLQEALSLGDKLIIYVAGKTVQTGTPQEIMTGPATPEVANLLMLSQDFWSFETIPDHAPGGINLSYIAGKQKLNRTKLKVAKKKRGN
jgi:molybdate transport system ATP-binding protein